MSTNFSEQSQIMGYPKYSSYSSPSHNIDLSKIVTLSALVEPDSNLSKLKEKIERLKFQIAGQQQEIFLLKKSKLRFSNSVALNEEVQLVKKINSDLRAKVLELSQATREYENKLQLNATETTQIEDKLRTVLQENIELKLQLHNNKTNEQNSKDSLIEKDTLASEIRDLKKQVSLMRDHFDKSIISLNSQEKVYKKMDNSCSIPKWSKHKSSSIDGKWTKILNTKSQVFEKLNHPVARPKKICGRLMNNHLNKEISKTICIASKDNLKTKTINTTSTTTSKKSDDSSMKSESSDESSETSSSTSTQSNSNDQSENQSDNMDSNSSIHTNSTSIPKMVSTDNVKQNVAVAAENTDNNKSDDGKNIEELPEIKLQLINETKSELNEQIDEKLQATTLLDIPCTCKVKSFFEKISENEVD